MENNYTVISLGGSIVVPDLPDPIYLKNFISLINEFINKGSKFIIIVGGGKTCRNYQNSLKQIRGVTNDELDILGVFSTVFNAEYVRMAFGDMAFNKVIQDPNDINNVSESVIIGAGWKTGNSTDLRAILFAEQVNTKTVINLSNIDFAYTKDPRTNPDAIKIESTTWAEFRKLLPLDWDPGLNAPFDPIAAKKAEELGIEVAIMNGKNLDNLRDYLDGGEFVGTRISN
jgi:uridylate kinase